MSKVTFSGYVPGAIGRITELHGTYYSKEWGFGVFFESKVAAELSEFLNQFDEAHDGFWVAIRNEKIIGSIAIDGGDVHKGGARLRWFIVSPKCQGLGIGEKLMRRAIDFCKEARFSWVRLSTFAGLDAARHIYEKWGFTLREEYEGNQWGSPVTEQIFQLDF